MNQITHPETPARSLQFPPPFRHEHPPVSNVNDLFAEQETFGQKAADCVLRSVGSWTFVIVQTILLVIWASLNVSAWYHHWDPYPFILMNLALSMQAAYASPLILMSQNRQDAKDRVVAHSNYLVNQKAETEIRAVLDHLAAQDKALLEIRGLLMKRHDREVR